MNKEDNNLEVKETESKYLLTEELPETKELVQTEPTVTLPLTIKT